MLCTLEDRPEQFTTHFSEQQNHQIGGHYLHCTSTMEAWWFSSSSCQQMPTHQDPAQIASAWSLKCAFSCHSHQQRWCKKLWPVLCHWNALLGRQYCNVRWKLLIPGMWCRQILNSGFYLFAGPAKDQQNPSVWKSDINTFLWNTFTW